MCYKVLLSLLFFLKTSSCTEYNEKCVYNKTNIIGPGECTERRDCRNTVPGSEQICGFYKHTIPLFCCQTGSDDNVTSIFNQLPTAEGTTEGTPITNLRISEQKCQEYNNDRNINPIYEHLISKGMVINSTTAPYIVALGYYNTTYEIINNMKMMKIIPDQIIWKCGGTLISERWVLTAAHCAKPDEPVRIRLGDSRLLDNSINEILMEYNVEPIIKHPSYSSNLNYYDIALIKSQQNIAFSKLAQPACLWTKYDIPDNRAKASGWGIESYGDVGDKILRQIDLLVVDNNECDEVFRRPEKLPNGLTSDFICARSRTGGDTCEGDSGGPLVITTNSSKLKYLIGTTSFGVLCNDKGTLSAGAYTRISHYIQWIEDTVWNNQ